MSAVRRISLELSYTCQEACPWCHNPPTRRASETGVGRFPQRPGELSASEWLDAIEKLAGLQPEIIILTGGEPLLVPWIYSLIQRIRKHGALAGLVTNGELLEAHAARLLEAGLELVWITFLGSHSSTNDLINGRPGSFQKKIRGVRSLRQAAIEERILLMVNIVVEPRNVSDVYETIRMLRDEGITIMHVEKVFRLGHAVERPQYFLSGSQHRHAVDAIRRATLNFPDVILHSQTLSPGAESDDIRPRPNSDFINIRPDGRISSIESGAPEVELNIKSSDLVKDHIRCGWLSHPNDEDSKEGN